MKDYGRNADVSKTLTEQWKKGELPYGRYYVELAYNGNNIIMAEYWWDKALTLDDHEYSREEVKRILAKVPSYDEYQQLKELLKEYKKQLSEIKNAYVDLTTQDEYGSYYIDEAKLFVEIVGKIIKDYDELELKQGEVLK